MLEYEWVTAAGLRAACWLRGDFAISWRCGYVQIPHDHVLYGLDYDDPRVKALKVHGGITFAQYARNGKPGDGDGWWIGFDCGHYTDALIVTDILFSDDFKKLIPTALAGEVRDKDFVIAQCEALASQIARLPSGRLIALANRIRQWLFRR